MSVKEFVTPDTNVIPDGTSYACSPSDNTNMAEAIGLA